VGRRQPVWTRPPGNTTSPARVLVLEVRRPRPLPWRLPGPCGALLLAMWNDGADVPRLPLPETPGRPPPASRRPPMPGHPEPSGTFNDPGASTVPAVRPPPATTPPSPSLAPASWRPQTFRHPRHIERKTVSVRTAFVFPVV
jgi:hypothetical protein